MKKLLFIFSLLLASVAAFSQPTLKIGSAGVLIRHYGRTQIDSPLFVLPLATNDSNWVVGADVNGKLVKRYRPAGGSTYDTSYLYSYISSVLDTAHDAKTMAQTALNGVTDLDTTKQDELTGPGYVKMSGGLVTYVTAIPNADLANSTISGKALGTSLSNLTVSDGTLMFASGTSYNGSASRDLAINPDAPQANFNLFNIGGTLLHSGVATPTQLTANVNDWDVADYISNNFINVIRVSSDATRNITGLANGNISGQVVTILNVGANDVVLKNASVSSSVGNRFILPADYTIAPDEGVTVWYDGTDGAWRMVAKEPATGGSGITTINSELADDQFLVAGTSGTDFAISSSAGTHTFNIPTVSGSARGLVTSALYNTWQAKQDAITSSADLRATLSDEVGTGAAYFVGGALGTPASATLTNATGLPVGGISATGTPSSTTYLSGDGTWSTPAGGGTSPDVQTFTSNGTWTKPAGARLVKVTVIGGGGGGGSGRKGAASSARGGGGGGAGGGYSTMTFDASDLTGTVAVTVGAGGTGGAAQTTNSTNGNAGTAGGNSAFGGYIQSTGGGAGGAGSTANSATPTAGSGITSAGGVGGQGIGQNAGSDASAFNYGASGGGGGGGISTANATFGGGNGNRRATLSNFTTPASNAGSAGGNGGAADSPVFGSYFAPGGGGSSTSGNGGNGGSQTAGNYGAGGGGGGGATDAVGNSGAGSNGADGVVIVITYF